MTVLTSRVDRSSEAFASRAAYMDGLLTELLGDEPADVVGHSMGGILGFFYQIRHKAANLPLAASNCVSEPCSIMLPFSMK